MAARNCSARSAGAILDRRLNRFAPASLPNHLGAAVARPKQLEHYCTRSRSPIGFGLSHSGAGNTAANYPFDAGALSSYSCMKVAAIRENSFGAAE